MPKKIKKYVVIVVLLLILIQLVLTAINTFYIDITALLPMSVCQYKSVGKSSDSAISALLVNKIDLKTVAAAVQDDPRFYVKYYTSDRGQMRYLLISREYSGLNNSIIFSIHPVDEILYDINVDFHTDVGSVYSSNVKCTVPDRQLLSSMRSFIDDLPIDAQLKKELKASIQVHSYMHWSM